MVLISIQLYVLCCERVRMIYWSQIQYLLQKICIGHGVSLLKPTDHYINITWRFMYWSPWGMSTWKFEEWLLRGGRFVRGECLIWHGNGMVVNSNLETVSVKGKSRHNTRDSYKLWSILLASSLANLPTNCVPQDSSPIRLPWKQLDLRGPCETRLLVVEAEFPLIWGGLFDDRVTVTLPFPFTCHMIKINNLKSSLFPA